MDRFARIDRVELRLIPIAPARPAASEAAPIAPPAPGHDRAAYAVPPIGQPASPTPVPPDTAPPIVADLSFEFVTNAGTMLDIFA